jgi:hypothetical protein
VIPLDYLATLGGPFDMTLLKASHRAARDAAFVYLGINVFSMVSMILLAQDCPLLKASFHRYQTKKPARLSSGRLCEPLWY